MFNRLFTSLPFLFPTLFLMVGIVAQRSLHFSLFFVVMLLLAALLVLIPSLRLNKRRAVTLGMGVLFVGVGMLLTVERDVRCGGRMAESAHYKVVVMGEPLLKGQRLRYDAQVVGQWIDSAYSERSERVWLYADTLRHDSLPIGSAWWVRGRLVPPRNRADSASGFDFVSYAKSRGLDYMLFASRYHALHPAQVSGVGRLLFWADTKRALAERVGRLLPDEAVAGVAISMMLGDKQRMPEERKEAFRRSGLVHLLAVSGLHVGIIFGLLYGLLFFIPHSSRWFWVKPLLAMVGVWSYVMVIGAPWSAVRAGCMITVLLLGEMTRHRSNSLNALLATAFVLLCVEPYALFDIGFQLSFSATAAILCGSPALARSLWHRSRVEREVLSVAGVSILAQMGTAPFTLYYFRSFPLLFLLANVVVLPFVGLLLGSTILLLALQECGANVGWLAEGLQWAYRGMVAFTEWVASVPWGVWEL